MMRIFNRKTSGQSVIEYVILLSVIVAVFLTMSLYMRRAVNAKLLIVENRINEAVR
jgi:hypothetical protein